MVLPNVFTHINNICLATHFFIELYKTSGKSYRFISTPTYSINNLIILYYITKSYNILPFKTKIVAYNLMETTGLEPATLYTSSRCSPS